MNRSRYLPLKLALTFAVAFSLLTIPGVLSNNLRLPRVPSAWAIPAPCPTHGSIGVCTEYWYPAGPAMDSFEAEMFGSAACEFSEIQGIPCCAPLCQITNIPPNPDLTDSPVLSNLIAPFNSSSNYYLTAPLLGQQFVYLSGWQRVVNGQYSGIPNFFTWLDAYNPNPASLGAVRQGFAQSPFSVNPYVASSVWDLYIVGNIYDSLETTNPLNGGQLLDWTTITSSQTPLSNSQLGYTPPNGTVGTYRFVLRNDLFFQDGRRATAFDVAFSYLSLKADGAYLGQGASSMTGVTVLGPAQFDINVNSTTFMTKPNLTSLPILPGHYWTGVGSSGWDSATATCTMIKAPCYPAQYTLGPTPPSGPPQAICSMVCIFSASNLNADPSKTSPTFDPIVNHDLIGSGPWGCGLLTSIGSGSCSSSGTMNVPLGGTFSLTRFGSLVVPGSSISQDYFRSSGNLALWIWSGDNGDTTHDFLNFATVSSCFGQPIQPFPNPCAHFQQGMGTNGIPGLVGLSQISIVLRFFGVNWVSPFNWQTNPPTGIAPPPGSGPPPLVLYAGSVTLNPAAVIGCPGGYDC